MRRFYISLAITVLLASTLWAADDPFLGKWKLNLQASKLAGDQIKIQDLGGNKYKWTTGNISNTITYDGTDQPTRFGRTISMSLEKPNTWRMVIKKDGRVMSTMTHTISADGKTQVLRGTEMKPDGTSSDFTATWKKLEGGPGWAGTWEETDVKLTSADEWDIEPYEGDGLTFTAPAYQDVLSMKFDGKDYAEKGPDVPAGSTSVGKRVNSHTLDVTDKVKGQIIDNMRFALSPDGKTLTVTIHQTGQPKSQSFVYDKM